MDLECSRSLSRYVSFFLGHVRIVWNVDICSGQRTLLGHASTVEFQTAISFWYHLKYAYFVEQSVHLHNSFILALELY